MKKIIAILFGISLSVQVTAQWQGTNPVYFNSGNVGIGTSSPGVWFGSKTLEFSDLRPVLKLSSTSPTGLSTIVFTNSNVNSSTHSGEIHLNYQFNQTSNDKSQLNLWAYPGSNVLTLQADGNVGIGTAAPTSVLHINSAVERNTFRIYKNTTTANYLSIWQGDGGAAIDPIGTGKLWLGYDQTTDVYVNGKIGIGTSNPQSKLEVHGTTTIGQYTNGTAVIDAYNSYAYFGCNTATNGLAVGPNGNVGIGTTSPDAKLAVSGQVHAQEVKVSIAVPGPDYVFEKEYKLTSLEDIKNYIDQNKHLPEVPSAKEMEKNGVQLGEMNMILLKKIEELTLHLLNQEKKFNAQEERIKELESVIKEKQVQPHK